MKFVPLAMLLGTLFASGQIADQVSTTGQVPDESVVPQWSATFPIILKARESHFLSFRVPNHPSGALSDEDLITGKKFQPPDIPRLQGSKDCTIVYDASNWALFECFFLPRGSSAIDMQNDFVRLVRLVEKATGGSAKESGPYDIRPTMEDRRVVIGKIAVNASWFPEFDRRAARIAATKARLKRADIADISLLGSHLSVSVSSDPDSPAPTASISGSGEIDEIIKSGRYTQMPTAQRVGSSGSGLASIKVTNDTAYTLSLVYEGISLKKLTIPARNAATIELPAGSFRVLGRVSAPGVLPFIGSAILGPGDNLVTSFFIK